MLFAGWAASIVYLSSLSTGAVGGLMFGIPGFDKFAHFTAFAVGAMLLANALHLTLELPRKKQTFLVIAIISIFGIIDEWHQLYTPGRSGADVGDWIADTLGAAAGVALFFYLYARIGSSFRKRPPHAAPSGN